MQLELLELHIGEKEGKYMSKEQLQKTIHKTRKAIENAVKELDFISAAKLRDELYALQKITGE